MGGVILGLEDLDYSRNIAEQVREGKPVRNILPWVSASAPILSSCFGFPPEGLYPLSRNKPFLSQAAFAHGVYGNMEAN